MSLFEVMKHQIVAVKFWGQGKHREAANEYWEAFKASPSPTHELRYDTLHGYTSMLRKEQTNPEFVVSDNDMNNTRKIFEMLRKEQTNPEFVVSDNDMNNMRKIFEDKHELRLFRLEAGLTLGMNHYSRSERHICEDVFDRAVTIGERKPKNAKQEKVEQKQMVLIIEGKQQMKPMKEIMEDVLKDCKHNLIDLNRNTKGSITFEPELMPDGTISQPARKTHLMPIGPGGTVLTEDEINNLMMLEASIVTFANAKEQNCSNVQDVVGSFTAVKNVNGSNGPRKTTKSIVGKRESLRLAILYK
eukprot:CAMPEP_0194393228 /NCGR_PEP_ID=MMETSP0174-20130528/123182_1 /TAXON_ID=216777 /ORGANISM="Proboscia alata, Strain PI-D3" /LENGTH=301 /DNA_ID=CAMNT_0039188891 /DNA_START=165 /DNA_END=1071 /DNA_ORIENTATION=+